VDNMQSIKATNEEAVALELEKTPLLGGIVFRGRFKDGVVIARTIPKIVLWRAIVVDERFSGFSQELVFLSEHPDMLVELHKLCKDIRDKKVSVHLESPCGLDYIENPESPKRQTTNIICRSYATNRSFYTDSEIANATIWFISPSKPVVVDKKEFLEALKKLLE